MAAEAALRLKVHQVSHFLPAWDLSSFLRTCRALSRHYAGDEVSLLLRRGTEEKTAAVLEICKGKVLVIELLCALRNNKFNSIEDPDSSVTAAEIYKALTAVAEASGRARRATEHRRAIAALRDPRVAGVQRDAAQECARPLSRSTLRRAKLAPEVLDVVVN